MPDSTWQERLANYAKHITEVGVSKLDGYKLNLPLFEQKLPLCVKAGLLTQANVDYVLNGLRFGFDLGIDDSKMPGRRVYKNYASAYECKDKVHRALSKRVSAGKTLRLGAFHGDPRDLPVGNGVVVPQGAVPKGPDSARPISDHTKTRLNKAVDLSEVEHTLNTYNEIAEELKSGYAMRVEDVDAAFPNLPLAPSVWKYMYVWWYDVDRPLEEQTGPNTLYVHVFADFGSAPLPGIWDKFFRCVKALATLDGVLTLPMPHFVDDNSVIGPDAAEVDAMTERLSVYMRDLGVPFKDEKSRSAATRQLVLGFWWDSQARTRTLETKKLDLYLEYLDLYL